MANPEPSQAMITAIVDTLIPAGERGSENPAVESFFARPGSGLGIDGVLADVIPLWPAHVRAAVNDALTLGLGLIREVITE